MVPFVVVVSKSMCAHLGGIPDTPDIADIQIGLPGIRPAGPGGSFRRSAAGGSGKIGRIGSIRHGLARRFHSIKSTEETKEDCGRVGFRCRFSLASETVKR
jgi:hypothetical protein